jgi:hypothetical protein
VCLPCVVRKTGVSTPKAADILARAKDVVAMTVKMARCDGCLRVMLTYQVRNRQQHEAATVPQAVSGPPPRVDLVEALWDFLTEHRGEMFCTPCLTAALGVTRRIDRVLFGAEGRGARRQHGKCARCGQDRLLCGLAP